MIIWKRYFCYCKVIKSCWNHIWSFCQGFWFPMKGVFNSIICWRVSLPYALLCQSKKYMCFQKHTNCGCMCVSWVSRPPGEKTGKSVLLCFFKQTLKADESGGANNRRRADWKTMSCPFPRPRSRFPSLFYCKTSTYESHLLRFKDKKHEEEAGRVIGRKGMRIGVPHVLN